MATTMVLVSGGSDLANAAALKWGRPSTPTPATAEHAVATNVLRDANVVAVAWEEDQLSINPLRADQAASPAVDGAVTPAAAPEDPFDQTDRFAQLPDDPFEEPVADAVPIPEPATEEVDDVADAIQEELDRREMDEDPFETEPTEEAESIESEPDVLDENAAADELSTDEDDWEYELDFDTSEDEPTLQPEPEPSEQLREQLLQEREAKQKNCEDELAKAKLDTISSIDLSIRVEGDAGLDYPFECNISQDRHQGRQWPEITYTWKASGLCHKPLYFEQIQLERYGHSWGPYLQPIMSGAHFFTSVPLLPYKMGIRTPCECDYTLGYYRPGDCAPYLVGGVPFTWRAAAFQTGVVTGLSFIIP